MPDCREQEAVVTAKAPAFSERHLLFQSAYLQFLLLPLHFGNSLIDPCGHEILPVCGKAPVPVASWRTAFPCGIPADLGAGF